MLWRMDGLLVSPNQRPFHSIDCVYVAHPSCTNRTRTERKKKVRITKKVWDAASHAFAKVAVEKEIPIK